MMRRVVDHEKATSVSYLELFRGTDLRRTAIVCGIYAAQNLAGNLIANQAVYFFERTSLLLSLSKRIYLLITREQRLACPPTLRSPWGLSRLLSR